MFARPLVTLLLTAVCLGAQEGKPTFPRAEIVPQPDDQLSFQVDGREVLRYHYGPAASKPYFFPVVGPAGRSLARLTHPQDPVGHSHHLGLWIAHHDVGGKGFWNHQKGMGRIVHDRIVKIEDGDRATLTIKAAWVDDAKNRVLEDERVWTLVPRYPTIGPNGFGEFFLDLTLRLTPVAADATFGKTNFGFAAVRVAKTMGVNDGGGRITDSEGHVDEKEVFEKRARWCDYSGPAAPGAVNGIALFDHPANPHHPTPWHVRNDGWMGAAINHAAPLAVTKEKPLVLRYRFWIHAGPCDPKAAEAHWSLWSKSSG